MHTTSTLNFTLLWIHTYCNYTFIAHLLFIITQYPILSFIHLKKSSLRYRISEHQLIWLYNTYQYWLKMNNFECFMLCPYLSLILWHFQTISGLCNINIFIINFIVETLVLNVLYYISNYRSNYLHYRPISDFNSIDLNILSKINIFRTKTGDVAQW